MKKVIHFILFISLILCLFGCSNWKNKIKVSELKINDGYIVGKIKNVTNQAYDATLEFELKSGSLKLNETCYDTFKPNKTKNIKCITSEDIDDTYEVKLKNIELEEKKIPTLKQGIISNETLKYYFEEIYNNHTLNFISIDSSYDGKPYPYIDSATYKNNNIEIKYEVNYENNFASFTEVYNTSNNELDSFYFSINGDLNDVFVNDIINKVAIMNSFRKDATSSINMLNALLKKDVKPTEYVIVDNWYVSPSYNKPMYFFSIHSRY